MNVGSTWKCFCLVVFFGCGYIFHLTDCITVSDVYADDKAEFTCVISPYTGSQIWSINSDTVAFCGAIVCSTESTNPPRYNFTPNVGTGTFIFEIDPTEPTDHNKIVGCFDGTETKSLPIILPDKDQNNSSITNTTSITVNKSGKSDRQTCGTLCIVFCCIGISLLLIICLVYYRVRPKFTKIDLKDTEIHLLWTDRLNCCLGCQLIFGYHIVCNPIKGQVTDTICRKYYTKKNYYTLRDLAPMAIYEISLSRKLCCCKSSAAIRYVITRKQGMPNDQGYDAMSTSIDVWWTKPDCINNLQLKYQVTCNEVEKENTGDTKSTITSLMPSTTYGIEVFAIDNGMNCLLFAEEITTTDLKVNLRDVCYTPGESCVECNIKWTIEDIVIPEHDDDIPGHLNESNNLFFNVICYSEEQVVHKKENIRVSSCTIPKLYPDRSYSVYVYPVYHSITFTPAIIDLTTPLTPKTTLPPIRNAQPKAS